jgi:hypothetical protein
MEDTVGDAFLKDVLALEGNTPSEIRQGVRIHLAEYEEQARSADTDHRLKDQAAKACRELCRDAVVKEKTKLAVTRTAEHLKLVLSVIDGPARFPLKKD